MGRRRPRSAKPSGPSHSLHAAVVEDERDLPSLTAAEAAVQLESFLVGWSRRRPGAVVRVITGKGNRSQGGPVLKPACGSCWSAASRRWSKTMPSNPAAAPS